MRRLLRALTLATLALATLSTPALAQEDEVEAPLVVLLKVPGGGTKLLAEALYDLEPIELRTESWFVKQAKSRGFSKNKALKKSKSMRWVMKGAKIDVIVRLRDKSEEYRVDLYVRETGKPAETFLVPRGEDGLGKDGAETIRGRLVALFDGRIRIKGAAVVATVDDPDSTPDPTDPGDLVGVEDPGGVDDPVVPRKRPGSIEAPGDFLWVYGGARLLKRDLTIGGQNGAVLSYVSAFYPGYQISAEFFPLVFTDQDFTALGLYVDFTQGFDGISFTDAAGVQSQFALTHLRLEGGLSYRIDTPRDVAVSGEYVRVRLRATVRHESFSIPENTQLPSNSQTAVVLSGVVAYPLLVEGFALTGSFELIPVSFWGASREQFGESSFTYGMGTSLGGLFSVGSGINVSFDYAFGLYRTEFEGGGTALFSNANAFELVQGLNAGVSFQM